MPFYEGRDKGVFVIALFASPKFGKGYNTRVFESMTYMWSSFIHKITTNILHVPEEYIPPHSHCLKQTWGYHNT